MYIEDLFLQFFKVTVTGGGGLFSSRQSIFPPDDYDVCHSFHHAICIGKEFTESQRTYVLSLLTRYKGLSKKMGLDYSEHLIAPTWKNPVRVINKNKAVWIEYNDEEHITWICLQFPYQLKAAFDEEVEQSYLGRSIWDHNKKIRKLSLYNTNLFVLQNFLENNGFKIDESYEDIFSEYEEIYANAEDIIPYIAKLDDELFLINCPEVTETYWAEHKTGNYDHDLLLAKFLGLTYIIPEPKTSAEKIAYHSTNKFWMPNIAEFVELCYNTDGQIGIVLDRAGNIAGWLENFYNGFSTTGHSLNDIKLCIKQGNHLPKELNKWLYDNKTEGTNKAKFLIFLHKPAKWIFKDKLNFSIIGTNAIYPIPNKLTSSWINDKPCIFYLTDIKPSPIAGQQIVKV